MEHSLSKLMVKKSNTLKHKTILLPIFRYRQGIFKYSKRIFKYPLSIFHYLGTVKYHIYIFRILQYHLESFPQIIYQNYIYIPEYSFYTTTIITQPTHISEVILEEYENDGFGTYYNLGTNPTFTNEHSKKIMKSRRCQKLKANCLSSIKGKESKLIAKVLRSLDVSLLFRAGNRK